MLLYMIGIVTKSMDNMIENSMETLVTYLQIMLIGNINNSPSVKKMEKS